MQVRPAAVAESCSVSVLCKVPEGVLSCRLVPVVDLLLDLGNSAQQPKKQEVVVLGQMKPMFILVATLKVTETLKVSVFLEVLSGVVVITSKDTVQHQGISLTMEGSVNLQLSSKSVGVFEAFYNSVKPIQIINSTIEMVKPGKLPSGKTEIPFEFPLQMKGNKVLYETYHGVFVNIQYTLRCDMRRSLLAKDLTKTCEFIVHSLAQKGKLMPSPVDFTITPETLQNVKERASLPKFLIRGHLSSTNCVITQPLTGELVVENAEAAVKSIELQLVRVETCGCAEGYARDATEIQNIQIADGDVCRGLPIPIYMVFPRLFTCPTLETTNFKVEFEVNIVVLLHDDHLITENFPLKLCRM
ncbi:Down syndrome critical region 3 [Columba livia]|uniref:Vacuolar protein sorting-associated protein 26C n=2 Tax=Columba livia TaxID=8932 RepID=A0A2I0MSK7_COLLI|nr:Down syndrome critical region 3 [Columba livia]